MFKKEEKKKYILAFWEGFAKHMNGKRNSLNYRINWLNYPTKVKGIRINLFADQVLASVNLDLEHPDLGIRELHLEQLKECQKVLESNFEAQLIWHELYTRENGKIVCRIQPEPIKSSLFNPEDHTRIYHYFEKNLRSFDRFWNDFGAIFDDLQ